MRFSMILSILVVIFFSATASARNSEGLVYPLDGHFEMGDGVGAPRRGHKHQGVDLGAAMGTPIVAVWDGVVEKVGHGGNGGWSVRLLHPNGVVTFYAHMKSRPAVANGQEIHQGEVLGYVGQSGDATYPHLHFEMREGKKVLNPVNYYGDLND
jgi:murein DD-endopeptidase MepM/ murein hydrolase activator NlpD